jgi:hypothetical protein
MKRCLDSAARPLLALALLLALPASAGCAQTNRPAILVRAGTHPDEAVLRTFDPKKQSLVIELREGDIVPLDVTLDGDVAATPAGASIPITIKRHCFVRVDDRGLRIGFDGVTFPDKARAPGSLAVGLGMTQAGTRATLRITTPER